MSKLTFIIPSIGRDTLENTIQSLENQTNDNWNAIIIFDGCEPTIKNTNDKIKIMQIEKIGGILCYNAAGAVRNEGIKCATTDWIAFLDDDDTIASNYVETFYNEIQEFNNIDVVIFRMVYKCNTILPVLYETNIRCGYIGISFAMKKSIFDSGINFNPGGCEDYDLLGQILNNNYKIMISPYIRYFVRCSEHIHIEYTNNNVIGNRAFIN